MPCRCLVFLSDAPFCGPVGGRLEAEARRRGGEVHRLGERAWLCVGGHRPPPVRRMGQWLVIGDAIPTANAASVAPLTAQSFVDQYWGRFIAIELDGDDHPRTVLRDPSGALDCFIWRGEMECVVASDTPPWLIQTLGLRPSVDLEQVSKILADPLSAWDRCALEGLEAVLPGVAVPLARDGRSKILWRPGDYVARPLKLRPEERRARMRAVVAEAVEGLAATRDRLGCEISGGLDSSIVAANLRKAGRPVETWLNVYGPDVEADERFYAAALGDHLALTPTFVPRREGRFTLEALERISGSARPGFNAIDFLHDEDAADLWSQHGVDGVMTGKGGDSIFIGTFDARIFTDLWREKGLGAFARGDLVSIARASGQSVGSILRQAIFQPHAVAGRTRRSALISGDLPDGPFHPWLVDLGDLGPAKRSQVAGVVDGLCFSAPSAQTEVVDLLHPLLARPVVELCLRLSAADLTLGRGERRLARETFASLLPDVIVRRRTKGDHTAYFGRMIAASLDILRPLLLEGRLARAGLIDRAACEAVLQRDSLIWRGRYGELLHLMTVEAWVSRWSSAVEGEAGSGSAPPSVCSSQSAT